MRPTILFVLIVSILTLTTIAWYSNSTSLDLFSTKNRTLRHEQIERIRGTTNIDVLKEQAVDLVLNIDERARDRESATIKAQNLLFLTMFLSAIGVVVAFFEIAARGRAYINKGGDKKND